MERTKVDGGVGVIRLLLPVLLLTGCSAVHLHSEDQAERARAAAAAWEKADLDEVTTTALSNVGALTEAERETHRRLNRLGFQIDLATIIDTAPGTGSADVALGWTKLVEETDAALEPFGFSIDDPKWEDEAAIKYAEADLQDFKDELRSFESQAEDFKDSVSDALPLEWKKMPEPGPEVESLLDEEGIEGEDREDYNALARIAAELRRLSAEPNPGFTLPGTDQDLRSYTAELRKRVGDRKAQIKQLSQSYRKAEKELKAAEKALAESTDQDALEALKTKVTDKLSEVTGLLEQSQNVPLVGEQLRTDALVGIIERFDELGDESSVANSLLAALTTDPSVAQRLGLSTRPPINSLVLELAVQQMAYERAVVTQSYDERELQLLEAMLQTQERSLQAWITAAHRVREKREHEEAAVASGVLSQTDLDRVRSRPLDEYFAKAAPEMKASVIEALVAYGTAKAHGEQRLRELDVERRSALRQAAIEHSRVSLTAWKAVVGAPLQALVQYHEGGITSQEIAEFLQAIGLGAVAVGVN